MNDIPVFEIVLGQGWAHHAFGGLGSAILYHWSRSDGIVARSEPQSDWSGHSLRRHALAGDNLHPGGNSACSSGGCDLAVGARFNDEA